MENSNNIFLVGFMGSGKTTLGKRLAKKLNKVFFDLDTEIEKLEKQPLNEIFEKRGEAYFRQLESKTLKKIIANNHGFVMSLGGGTPCFNANIQLINQSGTSIYLKHNSGILTSRLLNAKTERPLIKGLEEQELKLFVVNKLAEREVFYNQSKVVVEGNNLKVEDIIHLI